MSDDLIAIALGVGAFAALFALLVEAGLSRLDAYRREDDALRPRRRASP